MWRAEIDGVRLRFRLAGINNQNFLMRDEQTGSYWQQVSGRAIAGPLAGKQLTLVHSDELTFGLWKAEQPAGTVLRDDAAFASQYAPLDWDVKMARRPTVIGDPQGRLAPRESVLGVQAGDSARAYVYDRVVREKLVMDRVGSKALLLVTGPDGQSVRAFAPPAGNDFYRLSDGRMMDSATGSEWNFQGCAVAGKSAGSCLERVDLLRDYWFDWLKYHPGTTLK